MGTDIHGMFQKQDERKAWVDVPTEYEFDRHYQLFAVLAGVRNGVGFAGCPTGDSVEPISEPRGLPDDFEVNGESEHPLTSLDLMPEWRRKFHENDSPPTAWMGDHSFSWLTADEMLRWFNRDHSVIQYGVISRDQRESWDGVSRPYEYCGGIAGGSIFTVADTERHTRDDWTHVRVSWRSDLRKELGYFFREVQRLVDEHGPMVRFVFGFDS